MPINTFKIIPCSFFIIVYHGICYSLSMELKLKNYIIVPCTMQFVKPKSVLQQQRRLKSVEKGGYGRSRCHDKYEKGISNMIYSRKFLLSHYYLISLTTMVSWLCHSLDRDGGEGTQRRWTGEDQVPGNMVHVWNTPQFSRLSAFLCKTICDFTAYSMLTIKTCISLLNDLEHPRTCFYRRFPRK